MLRVSMMILALFVAVPTSQAADFLDWLKPVTSGKSKAKAKLPADDARLLTLEPGESELYPKVSPDGKTMLVVVSKRKSMMISRRLLENGDPVNVVSDDSHAPDSFAWHGNGQVTFLSKRAGGLGLWEKAADGRGVLRRLHSLNGQLTQPILLKDGSIIAVRLNQEASRQAVRRTRHDVFANWSATGYRAQIIRVQQNGAEQVLSEGTNPAVSPDGNWVVFSMAAGRSQHLFMMRVDGSELVQLTDARSIDVQPAWSPDGKWIVFTSNRSQADMRTPSHSNWDIWAIDRNGRNLSQLTLDKARDGGASVAPNGRVYFHSDRKVSKELKTARQVKGSVGGFHIWSIAMPSGK
ncbi:MAG: TolB family protein [Mariprofundaceae bacterium]